MKAKLIIDGQELEVMLSEQDAKNLGYVPKKNGYERSEYNKTYFTEGCGYVQSYADWGKDVDEAYYKCANYYSEKTVAENNTRADNLMRQIRRFAVNCRERELSWNIGSSYKWNISYDYHEEILFCHQDIENRAFGAIYFDSKLHAKLAIETFKDEFIWYFAEYKDSL